MPRDTVALSITQYATLFAGLTLVMFAIFGGLTYVQLQRVHGDLARSNAELAQQEIIRGSERALEQARRIAAGFAEQDEVRQRLDPVADAADWQRIGDFESLPPGVLDAHLYDARGRVLASTPHSPFPPALPPRPTIPLVQLWQGEPMLLLAHPILSGGGENAARGYVALRLPYLPLLRQQQYRLVDPDSLALEITPGQLLAGVELAAAVRYQLGDDPMAAAIETALSDALLRLGSIIGVLWLVFYPSLVYLIRKPLCAISQHIDRLKQAPDGLALEPTESLLPIAEVEKVRNSLNDYHERLRDVHSSLDETNRKLWRLAHHDALTGVMNRRAFDDYWRSINELLGDLRFSVCLVLFDVNHFKAINDSYGHQVGDRVLKAITGCLQSVLRRGEQLYRLGGDEFAAVLIDCDRDNAQLMAERCRKAVAAYPFHRIGVREPIRISIGLAHAPTISPAALQNLQRQADIAMYHAKRPGRFHIATFTPELAEITRGIFSNVINNAVFEAITHGVGLTMFYQPVVELENNAVAYYEALLRIRNGEDWIPPSTIFPLVEARRLEADLDRAVFRRILQDLREHRLPAGCGVSLNMSGPSLANPRVTEWLEPFRAHMDAHHFVLEITETALITHLGLATEVLDRLRAMGFEVALDDFGSGYSSVRYLASMPVDVVKFDISLIRLLEQGAQHRIVLHLAQMILESGYRLVAEGIETEAQLAAVYKLGFAYGQGYLFGRPEAVVTARPQTRLRQHQPG